ncbi:MAG: hypothetical protein ACTS46_00910 [Candidatus Hodgkinia cicadicola]
MIKFERSNLTSIRTEVRRVELNISVDWTFRTSRRPSNLTFPAGYAEVRPLIRDISPFTTFECVPRSLSSRFQGEKSRFARARRENRNDRRARRLIEEKERGERLSREATK